MGSFNRDGGRSSGGFGRGGFGGGKSFGGGRGGRDGARPTMHKAVCSECGDSCEIPFRPTGDRPVFCSNCFSKQQGDSAPRRPSFGGDRNERHERRERPSFGGDREMFDATCDKCGNDCQVPFRPTSGKPVFCSDCFDKKGSRESSRDGGSRDSGEVMEQIKLLNNKFDKLLSILSPATVVEKPTKEKTKKEEIFFDTPVEKTVETKKVRKPKTEKKVASKKVTSKKK
ncbi:MAG: CxxC-x17-CxxC domain-containing protein [Candidatus Magasanikbacteria bacterium]